MSIILNMLLYLLVILLTVFLLFIIFPIKYCLYGQYNNGLSGYGSITLLKFCKISVLTNSSGTNAKISLLGFSFNIDLKTDETSNFNAKNSHSKKQKNNFKQKHQNLNYSVFFKKLLQKDIILHILSLLKDLFNILKPKVLRLTGKIGFSEPHHTAWLEALLSSLSPLNYNNLNIQTVWDDEYYQINLMIKGHLSFLRILTRLLKFVFSKSTWKVWRIYRLVNY